MTNQPQTPTRDRYVTPEQAAREVAEQNNNRAMEGMLRLYLECCERAGFRLVRAPSGSIPEGRDVIEEECMDAHRGDCSGPVEFHSIDPGRTSALPRCDKHWGDRLDARENSMERYENSDVAPDWFDPSIAGERWDDDY